MADQDPFRTFKSWHRWSRSLLPRIDSAGVRLERAIVGKIPSAAKSGADRVTGLLERQPLVCFALFFVLVCTRATHWLANPQFYIEDGKEFYAPAFNEGVHTLWRAYASYYHLVPRILSLIAAAFPVRYGPLVLELLALAIQAVSASFLVTARLAKQFPSVGVRFGLAFMVIGYPYSNELFGNVAHSQWYLGILSLAIICSEPGKRVVSRVADSVTVGLSCLTGPFAPIVAGISWSGWRGDKQRRVPAVIATVCAVVTLMALTGEPRTGIHRGSRFSLFERIISNQIVLGPIRGYHYVHQIPYTPFFDLREFFTALFGVVVIVWAVRKAPPLIKALAVLGTYSFLSSLITKGSWALIGDPGVGERYFLHIGLVMLFSVYFLSATARFSAVRWFFRAVLAICALATVQNWVYDPPFERFNYAPQIAKYDRLKPGEKVEIVFPIDRKLSTNSWTMDLIKK